MLIRPPVAGAVASSCLVHSACFWLLACIWRDCRATILHNNSQLITPTSLPEIHHTTITVVGLPTVYVCPMQSTSHKITKMPHITSNHIFSFTFKFQYGSNFQNLKMNSVDSSHMQSQGFQNGDCRVRSEWRCGVLPPENCRNFTLKYLHLRTYFGKLTCNPNWRQSFNACSINVCIVVAFEKSEEREVNLQIYHCLVSENA